jgi:exopolyphosphatase/pppGpp-phosphohydrolase
MTTNAARIALIANQTLARLLEAEASLDVKDLPSMLNAAAKLAEVGKNLQSSALGVDSLLSALEEGEG